MTDASPPTAVITGASRGLGRAIAERLTADGYRCFLCGTGDAVFEVAARLPNAVGRRVDVGDHDAMSQWGAEIRRSSRSVDVVVHNAAPHRLGLVSAASDADFDLLLKTQLVGPLALTNALVPAMPSGGSIVFVASALSKRLNPHMAATSVAKHGVVVLVRALANVLAKRGIRVNAVCPGTCRTDYLEVAANALGGDTSDVEREITNVQRLGLIEPSEVADLVARLTSKASAKITGWAHYIDGASLDSV